MLIIPQDPSDNDTEDGGKTITQDFSFKRLGMVAMVGGWLGGWVGGTQWPLGASAQGPTSWLINPIKSPESVEAPGVSSLFFPPMVCNNRKCNDSCPPHLPPSTVGSSSHLRLTGWQGGRDRTGCPLRQDNRTGRGKEKRGK